MDFRSYVDALDAAERGDSATLSQFSVQDLETIQSSIPNWLASTSVEARATIRAAISDKQIGSGATASLTPSHPGHISHLPNLRQAAARIAALTEIEKQAIVDEPGCASNIDLLDLGGTEYVDGELPLFL